MLAEFDGIEILDDCDLPRDREARMQEAFERSKLSYPSEQIFTEIGHFKPSTRREDLTPANALIPEAFKESDSIALRLRRLEYRLNDLYLRGLFREALDLGLAEIDREESNEDGKDGREQQILDLIVRCTIQLSDFETAVSLADKIVRKYTNIPGLLATASEAYLHSKEARKALPAILRAISIRGPLPPFLHLLYGILASLQEVSRSNGVGGEAASALGDLRGYVELLLQPRIPLLRNGSGAPSNIASTTVPSAIPEQIVRERASAGRLSDSEEQGLVALLCRGISTTTVEDIRSVRGI